MCGIFAIFSKNAIDKSKAKFCCKHLDNRGPDNFGYLHTSTNNTQIFLGHTRLSIVDDSSSSNQPFSIELNSQIYTIIFNGELYNYKEVKKLLADEYSYVCKTSGDTEVILASYAILGETCFSLFDGVWALVIYDGNKIVASRDRLGEKPLYKYETNNELIFSSQISPILAYLGDYSINFYEVNAVTLFGYHGDILATCFKGIDQFSPATYEIYNCSFERFAKKASTVFWEITDYIGSTNSRSSYDDATLLTQLIKESVLARVPKDSQFGLTLSGGVDSTIMAYCLALNQEKFETFTNIFSTFDLAHVNESEQVQNTVDELNIKANFVELGYHDPDHILHIYEKKIRNYECPISDIGLSGHTVYESIRKNGFKVVLEGQGADEIFGGYEAYRSPFTIMRSNLITSFYRVYKNEISWNDFILKHGNIKSLYRYYISKLITKRAKQLDIDIDDDFLDYLVEREFNSLPDFRKRKSINRFICSQIQRNLSYLLFTGDRDSMLHGVESRLPFTNHRLVELALRQSATFFMDDACLKVGLKRAAQDFVPRNKLFSQKKKIGYPDAFDYNLATNDRFRNFFDSYLRKSKIKGNVDNIFSENLVRASLSRELFLNGFA